MKIFIFSLLLPFAFFGCTGNDTFTPFYQAENASKYNKVMDLHSVKLKEFPLEPNVRFSTSSIGVSQIGDSEYLSFLDTDLLRVVIFDYHIPENYHMVQMEYEGPHGVGNLSTSAHYLHSFDSIYVLIHFKGELVHLSDSGQVRRRYMLADYKNESNPPMPMPSTSAPIQFADGKLLIASTISFYQGDYHGFPSSMSVYLASKEVKYHSKFPELYSEAYWGTKFKYEPGIAYIPSSDELVMSYPVDPFLQKINLNDGSEQRCFVGSEFFESIPPYRKDPDHYAKRVVGSVDQEEDNHALSTSDFRGIYFDRNRKLYFRVALIRPGFEKLSVSKVPDFSIIILNEQLEKIGERFFSSCIYDPAHIFLSSEGINLFRKDLYGKNENKITFEVFEPKNISSQ